MLPPSQIGGLLLRRLAGWLAGGERSGISIPLQLELTIDIQASGGARVFLPGAHSSPSSARRLPVRLPCNSGNRRLMTYELLPACLPARLGISDHQWPPDRSRQPDNGRLLIYVHSPLLVFSRPTDLTKPNRTKPTDPNCRRVSFIDGAGGLDDR